MTADRWWVRAAARWIARIDSVQGQLGLVFQAMTGVSLASGALKYFGLSQLVPWFLASTMAFVVVYAYLYSEGGVWNQVSRDKQDLSTNFAGPTMRIDDELTGCAVFAAVHGREPTAEEREAIASAVDKPWQEYREGISLDGESMRANGTRDTEDIDA